MADAACVYDRDVGLRSGGCRRADVVDQLSSTASRIGPRPGIVRLGRARPRSSSQALIVPAHATATLPRENVTLTILSGKLERLNADTRSLSLHIRFSNNGTRSFYRTYYSNLRLVIDGVLHAPTDAPIAQVDASSAGEFDYRFDVPVTASRAVLRIIHDDQTAEIPLDFTTTKP